MRVDAAFFARRRAERRAVVEEAAPIPVAIPGLAFAARVRSAAACVAPARGARRLTARVGNGGERRQARRAGTSRARRFRPRRSSPTRFMPSFQSPLPISGRPWRRRARLASSARAQCSKRLAVSSPRRRRGRSCRARRLQPLALQEGHCFVEHGGVAGDARHSGRRRRRARRGRRRCACARPGPSAAATNAGRRPRRTGGRRAQQMLARHRRARAQASAMPSCSWSRKP